MCGKPPEKVTKVQIATYIVVLFKQHFFQQRLTRGTRETSSSSKVNINEIVSL